MNAAPFERLSPRARHVLRELGIATVDDLKGRTAADFLETSLCGRRTAMEIIGFMMGRGIQFETDRCPCCGRLYGKIE